MNVMFITIAVLLALFLIALTVAIVEHGLRKKLEEAHEKEIKELKQRLSYWEKSDIIKGKNREEANEKIDDLHSGKLSADDVLPKPKG